MTLCLEALPDIRQYQVVQREDMSLDVYFDCAEQHTESVRQGIFTVVAALCGSLPLRVTYQKHTLNGTAGKFRPVQSEIRASS